MSGTCCIYYRFQMVCVFKKMFTKAIKLKRYCIFIIQIIVFWKRVVVCWQYVYNKEDLGLGRLAWTKRWSFMVCQVKFNSFLHPEEHAQRIFSYLVKQFVCRPLKLENKVGHSSAIFGTMIKKGCILIVKPSTYILGVK